MFECDYYTNPTVLSQCIRMEDYEAASRRLAKHPEEARVFVCRRIHLPAKSTDTAKVAVYQPTAERQVITTSRTLPLHLALSQSALPTQRNARNQLLAELITAYPESCRIRTQRYVLEYLIAERSTTQLVSLALAAYPAAIDKIASDIPMPHRLRQLLQRGVSFWDRVRVYAKLSPDQESLNGDISLKTNGIQDYEALEQRCLVLERLLLSANAENYELQQEINEKDRIIADLQSKLSSPSEPVDHKEASPMLRTRPASRMMQYRGQDGTSTIVSSLSVDQSRIPSRKSSSGGKDDDKEDDLENEATNSDEDEDDYDDEDTTAMLESICRPLSPLDSLMLDGTMVNQSEEGDEVSAAMSDQAAYPWVPNLDDTETSASDGDDITVDTVLREAELWRGRKLSPKIIRAWNQIPSPPRVSAIRPPPTRHSVS